MQDSELLRELEDSEMADRLAQEVRDQHYEDCMGYPRGIGRYYSD